FSVFFFQAEDGIRDRTVTGVQTCALPIFWAGLATPGKASPAQTLLGSIVQAKDAASGGQLFWRAVLCNALVCLGLWMAARTRSDAAKCIVLWWALLAFVASGFEHSIANMTTFSLAALDGSGTWSMLFHNLAWTVPGNIVGGALVVGGSYAWLGAKT